MARIEYRTRQQDLLDSYIPQLTGKHFTAEDICTHFANQDVRVSPATVYRYLDKLLSQGLVEKYIIDEHSAACFEYVGKEEQDLEEHFHLKCENCGKLIHLECEELCLIQNHLKAEHGFLLNPHRTVFYGLCKTCTLGKKST